jgi:hypothetical protein
MFHKLNDRIRADLLHHRIIVKFNCTLDNFFLANFSADEGSATSARSRGWQQTSTWIAMAAGAVR